MSHQAEPSLMSMATSEKEQGKLPIIFVMGAPGSGKGTVCKSFVAKNEKYHHLSVGDYLRELCQSNELPAAALRGPGSSVQSSLSQDNNKQEVQAWDMARIRGLVRESALLPGWLMKDLLVHKLRADGWIPNDQSPSQQADGETAQASKRTSEEVLIIDGYPRSREGAELFGELGQPRRVVMLRCHTLTSQDRFLARNRSANDTKEKFLKRLVEFEEELNGITQYYGKAVLSVNSDQTPARTLLDFETAIAFKLSN